MAITMNAYPLGEGERDAVLVGETAHVDDGIAHPSQGGIDADTSILRYLAEAQILIEAKEDDLALHGGERSDELTYIGQHLMVGDTRLGIVVAEISIVEEVCLRLVVGNDHFSLLLTEIVNNKVMSYAREPGAEASHLVVTSLTDSDDGLHKGLLKEILCQSLIADNE